MSQQSVTICITTKNRLTDLKVSLEHNAAILSDDRVQVHLYDDGSTDGTYEYLISLKNNFKLFRNETSKGYLFCRNFLLNQVETPYAISLDDDAHFLSKDPISHIESYFKAHPQCGTIAFRIYWGIDTPQNLSSNESNMQVKSFVGCGHCWNMKAWNTIPPYPEWFEFYGEEEFASHQLFLHTFEVHYVPEIFIQHRVDLTKRNKDVDRNIRYRRSMRAGWYIMFLFTPLQIIPKLFLYSLAIQIMKRTLKGDLGATFGLVLACKDLITHIRRFKSTGYRFTMEQYHNYLKVNESKIFWKPEIYKYAAVNN